MKSTLATQNNPDSIILHHGDYTQGPQGSVLSTRISPSTCYKAPKLVRRSKLLQRPRILILSPGSARSSKRETNLKAWQRKQMRLAIDLAHVVPIGDLQITPELRRCF